MNTPESAKSARPKVAILGATGMIGSAIYGALLDQCDLVVVYRSADKLAELYQRYGRHTDNTEVQIDLVTLYSEYVSGFQGQVFGERTKQLVDQLAGCDWVINAAGITKPIANHQPEHTWFINGALPHILAAAFHTQLIHITTDCVFDGSAGAPYDEASAQRPTDLYGLSKAVGEPTTALVIRTSTIGPELGTHYGLLEWFLSQPGSVTGFTNHFWNGLTAGELGQVCRKLVTGEVSHPGAGTYHIFSDAITKHDLLVKLRNRYDVPTIINPQAVMPGVDRRLTSRHNFCAQLQIPSLDAMVAGLPEINREVLSVE